MTETLVSAVIPVFNGGRYLRECLDSALAQTYMPIEVIVVNDGSTDTTADILTEYNGRIQVIHQENKGNAVALNRAVAASNGRVVAFLDSDDVWDSNKIERQIRVLQQFPQALAVYCDHRNIDSAGVVIGYSGATSHVRCSGQILLPMIRGNFIVSPSTVMVRTDTFRAVGGLDEAHPFLGSKDYGLWLRLAARGPIIYQCETLASYRRHGSSISARIGLNRIPSVLYALRGLEPFIKEHPDNRVKVEYRGRLYRQILDAGWYFTSRGEIEQALRHYFCAIRMKPCALRTWTKLFSTPLRMVIRRRRDSSRMGSGTEPENNCLK